jgi:hypothetical protein
MEIINTEGLSISTPLDVALATRARHPGRRAWATNQAGCYIWANACFAGDLGLSVGELIGLSCVDIGPKQGVAGYRVPVRVATACGDEFSAMVTASEIRDPLGEACGYAGYYDAGDGLAEALRVAKRRAETQLALSIFTDSQLIRYADGAEMLRQEFSA